MPKILLSVLTTLGSRLLTEKVFIQLIVFGLEKLAESQKNELNKDFIQTFIDALEGVDSKKED